MRYKKIIVFILFQVLMTHFLIADTHIPPGDVSGTWTIDGSPYIIDGHINVPKDSLLSIDPEVCILFSDWYYFRVYGTLLAKGTETDSILFSVIDTTDSYATIIFCDLDTTSQDSSRLTYCIVDHGYITFSTSSSVLVKNSIVTNGAGIGFNNSNSILYNVIVKNNTSPSYGGGIICTDGSCPRLVHVTVVGNNPGGIWCSHDSDPIIENSSIMNNIGKGICCTYSSSPSLYNVTISGNTGGGITCSNNSNIILENVKICDNSVWGGIYSTGSSPILTNVTLIGNSTDEWGGGICLIGEGVVTLRNVKIIGNTSDYDGGGICIHGDISVTLMNVLVANNYAWNSGGGINIIDVPFFMAENVTVCDNSTDGLGGGIMCQLESDAVIKNSIVWNNSGGEIVEYWTGGDAVAVYYSDVRGGWSGPGSHNINSDPLFSDDDYRLFEDSPCIDTGSPDTTGSHLPPWDLDGHVRIWDGNGDGIAVIDMGVYEYGAPVYSVHEPEIHEQSLIYNYPNPFTESTTISFLKTTEITELKIYNIKGQLIKTIPSFPNPSLGTHEVVWDGKDDRGKKIGAGMYFIYMKTGEDVNVKKIVKFGM